MDVGNNIKVKKGAFSFGGKTPKNFDSHISKSVPLYELGQDLICKISSFFLNNESYVYDLGCSTGTLIKKIIKYNSKIKFKIIGVDKEPNMIKEAKKKLKRFKKVSLKCSDLRVLKLKNSDLISCYYTIQFIMPKYRQKIFNKVYKSLNWGGAFLLFEKVRGSDARFQDMMTQIYNEHKNDVGYDEKQIYHKSLSIRGQLEPFTSAANLGYLKRAGFKDVMSVMKYGSFEGFLAIK